MDWYYANSKPLPINEAQLYRVCGAVCEQEKESVVSVVREFFRLEENGWVHDRIEEELEKKAEISQKRREAREIGVQNKAQKANKTVTIVPTNAPTIVNTSTTTSTYKDSTKGYLTEYDLKDPTWKVISEEEDDLANPGNRRMFYGEVIKLREKDYNLFARLAGYELPLEEENFREELRSRDGWLASKGKSFQKSWFMSTKKHMENLGKP